jgi:hypothetical protein
MGVDVTGPLFSGPAGAHGIHWMAVLAILLGVAAVPLLLWRLVGGHRLPIGFTVAAVLLPVAAYGFAMLHMMEGSQQVTFCGSCHVMTPILKSLQGNDGSLASMHYARGLVPHDKACFTCHSGYGIWGGIDAKMAGVRHMLHSLTGDYEKPLTMNGPFDIDSCLGCHAFAVSFRAVEAHRDPDLQKQLVTRELSCTGACHPPAHPPESLMGGVPAS